RKHLRVSDCHLRYSRLPIASNTWLRWRRPVSARVWTRLSARDHLLFDKMSMLASRFTRWGWPRLVRVRCSHGKISRPKRCRNGSISFRNTDGRHDLIAGERRWRAAQEVGLSEVPVIVRTASDLEVLELSLIENLQRTDLNPIEEAQGYSRLAEEFGMRQEDIALKVGRSRAAVANAIRLLDLHPQIQ